MMYSCSAEKDLAGFVVIKNNSNTIPISGLPHPVTLINGNQHAPLGKSQRIMRSIGYGDFIYAPRRLGIEVPLQKSQRHGSEEPKASCIFAWLIRGYKHQPL